MTEETVGNTMPSVCNSRLPRRIKFTEQQLEKITLEDLIHSWHEQELYIDAVESQVTSQEADMVSLRESEERMRQQHLESTHREKVLVRRLATKEQEMQEYASQIAEFKAGQTAGSSALRSALLDPAVNLLLQRLRGELLSTRSRLEETQNELSAWKFTPDSNTGKRLMAKCRLLYQENEELGRMISSGRLAKLEGELALQKSFSDEVKKSQSELDEFLQDLDEDVEGMQSTIYYLQQELRKSKEAYIALQQQKTSPPTLEARVNTSSEKSSPIPIVKEQSTITTEELRKECAILPLKSSPPASLPSSPVQDEPNQKSGDIFETVEMQNEIVAEETTMTGQITIKEEPREENACESRFIGVAHETLNENDNDGDTRENLEVSDYTELEAADKTEKVMEIENNVRERIKEEELDDSQGELMIEVGSEQGDNEDDEYNEEKCLEKVNKGDLGCVNGLFKHIESPENTEEDEKDTQQGRRKRASPETSPNSSDEDSDDTPLIKKVRRNHDQALKSKV